MKYLSALLLLMIVIGSACSQNEESTPPETPAVNSKNLQTIIKERNIPKSELSIKIDKSAYTLAVFHNDSMLISYPCVFGFNEVDDKRFVTLFVVGL